MENQLLSFTAECRDNPACIFSGGDVFVDIVVKNVSSDIVGYPARFLQARGPSVRLIDQETQRVRILKTGLADLTLKTSFTDLQPGQSVTLHTVITMRELTTFRKEYVDIRAEIVVPADVRVPGKADLVPLDGGGKLRIRGRDTLERGAVAH